MRWLVGLLAVSALAGCGDTFTPGERTDECAPAPIQLTLSGADERVVGFDPPLCVVGSAAVTATWAGDDGLLLRLTVEDLTLDDVHADDVHVELEDPETAWAPGASTVSLWRLDPPCGEWTINAFQDEADDLMAVSPQPIPLACPE